MRKLFNHLRTVLKHKRYVYKVGRLLGVGRIQLIKHDLSKFSPTEMFGSMKYWTGTGSPIGYQRKDLGHSPVWMHHKGVNKHHWEYWLDFKGAGNEIYPIKMPFKYAMERVADVCAASMVYNKTDMPLFKDIIKRVITGTPKELIHEDTQSLFLYCLTKLYEIQLSVPTEDIKSVFEWFQAANEELESNYNNFNWKQAWGYYKTSLNALYYGSFDPIHEGHVGVMRSVASLAPGIGIKIKATKQAVYADKGLSSNEYRADVIKRTMLQNRDIRAKLVNSKESYHQSFYGAAVESNCLLVVIGADNILTLETHFNNPSGYIQELLEEKLLVVVGRNGETSKTLIKEHMNIYKYKDSFIDVEYSHPASSSEIRNCINFGMQIRSGFLSPGMELSIRKSKSYEKKEIIS